jgi:ligand-binding sensor domain-containing protein
MKHLLALAFCLIPTFLYAQAFQWTTFTSTTNVVDMTVLNGHVWTATTGGLSDYDPATGSFQVYTNTRGLAMNQCVAVGKDALGYVWAGLLDGRITRINPVTGDVKQVSDLQGEVFEITDILDVGDEVFVSANSGIYRLAYYAAVDNYRVFESITVLDTLPRNTRVSALAAFDGFLYAGTSRGLARADLSKPVLSQSSAWEILTVAGSGLPENGINVLGTGPAGLWIGTTSHTACFDGTHVSCISNLNGVVSFSGAFAAQPDQVYHSDGAGGWANWTGVASGLGRVVRLVSEVTTDTVLVAGIGDRPGGRGGLSFFNGDLANPHFAAPISAPGIGGNSISALAMDLKGKLWAGGGGDNPGVYIREGENWNNIVHGARRDREVIPGGPTAFAFDDYGGTWISTEGGGTVWMGRDTVIFNSTDSTGFSINGPRLTGIPVDPNFVVTRVCRNAAGDIYMTNRISTVFLPLLRVPAAWIARGNNPDPWNYYSIPDRAREVQELIVDGLNRIWVGPSSDGERVYVLNDRGTPADTTDDSWFSYIPAELQDATTCFEPLNKMVLHWVIDHQGYLWVGTLNGAYYTQAGIPQDLRQLRFICVVDLPIGHQVNTIHVDELDNKWFGTDQGVAVMDKNFTWVNVFQTANSVDHASDLVSNNVLAITSDPQTGEVWVGTADGLSRFTSPYVTSRGDLGEIWPYPNPFRADGTQHMCLDPERLGQKFDEFRVFTMSGRLVRKLTWAQMTAPRRLGGCVGWDGRNDDGDLVAGGVYVLLASSADGKSATGKVAVLGK